MEPLVPAGVNEDTDILTAVVVDLFGEDDDNRIIENLFDVPFVSLDQIDGDELEAEVVLSLWNDEINQDRIALAHAEARKRGYRSYARIFGDLYDNDETVRIFFSDSPDKGIIWALEGEMGRGWLQ